jgi:hypothetical protein
LLGFGLWLGVGFGFSFLLGFGLRFGVRFGFSFGRGFRFMALIRLRGQVVCLVSLLA